MGEGHNTYIVGFRTANNEHRIQRGRGDSRVSTGKKNDETMSRGCKLVKMVGGMHGQCGFMIRDAVRTISGR